MSGCSANFDPALSGGQSVASTAKVSGVVHGGQGPISGAAIYILQTGLSGYPSSSVSANTSVANSGTGVSTGTVAGYNLGNYVTTDSSGSFTFTNGFTCTSGAGVYMLAVSGQPLTGVTNTGAVMMTPMGICPAGGASALLASTSGYFYINEMTTVAMAFALEGFTAAGYNPSHISSSSTNTTGLANAFAMAKSLIGSTPAFGAATNVTDSSGHGYINESINNTMINSLANILADCVNSNGSTATTTTPCYILYNNATSNGTAGSGTVPTDVGSAAINIAHYQQSNVSTLYALASNSYIPFSPTLTSAPGAFTVTITVGDVKSTSSVGFVAMALDVSGNAWVTDYQPSRLFKVSPAGILLATATSASGLNGPYGLAIDTSGNVLVANEGAGNILKFTNAGVYSSTITNSNFSSPQQIAFDGVGNIWVGDVGASSKVIKVTGSGTTIVSVSTGNSAGYIPLAVDSNNNVWVGNFNGNYASELNSSGVTQRTFGSGSGIDAPFALAVDRSNDIWMAVDTNSELKGFTSTGSYIGGLEPGNNIQNPGPMVVDGGNVLWQTNYSNSAGANRFPVQGFTTGLSNTVQYVSQLTFVGSSVVGVDISGNLWFYPSSGIGLVISVGAATPVVAPLAAGVANNTIATRP